MNPEDKSKIDELNKSLYSRNTPDIRTKRKLRFHEQISDVQTDWQHVEDKIPQDLELNKRYKDHTMSFLTKILTTSFIFFLIALGIGAYLVFNGSNIVSANNIDITINGPVSVAGGEPVTFEIQVSNHNNIKLETVDLAINFPIGTTDADNSSKELKNFRGLIDDIAPGGIGQKTMKAIIYGEENTKKEIKVLIEYRVKGSNAIFQKEKIFDFLISSSPITLTASSFKEVNSGQEFEITASLNSNSKEVIKNLLLKADYPFGFTFISSDIKTSGNNNIWKIGDLPPGSKKMIKIKGKIDGQDGEVRVFRFITGSYRFGNDKVIGTEYTSSSQEVSIAKPFMTVGISLDGDKQNSEYISNYNKSILVNISYFNNLPTSILDSEISVKISGSAFDKDSVSSSEGLYKSANNEIVWNSITTRNLNNIEAGGSGEVSFSITPRDLSTSQKIIINPDMKFIVSIKSKRNSESNVPENIISTARRDIKISSNISLSGQILHSSGVFPNTGPIPPKAEKETTYTVVWTIDNTANNTSGVQVQSSLPPYVKWLGNINPTSEDIVYDSVNGQIVWNVGGVGTYTAGTNRRKQISFQISLNPSINQVNQTPILLNQSYLTATDDFTGEILKSNLDMLTTRLSTDPNFKDGNEVVGR